MDGEHWERRLAQLARDHDVPAVSLAVLEGDAVTSVAVGVLNLHTGLRATPDAVFQIGSITKVYTATVIMRLVDQGKLDLDAPIRDVLPDFQVADPDVTAQVTARHLLSHTSGIAGECFTDTGPGDDCIERYVQALVDLGQDIPLGATMSYCNTGFVILGRVIEVLTGLTWDDAMRQELLEPLGLRSTETLPEGVLAHRYGWGHAQAPGEPVRPIPVWQDSRALGPAGFITATAADVVAVARMHLDDGLAADGTRVLSSEAIAAMQRPHVEVPEPWATGDHWGLGWTLLDYEGRRLYGHDGNTFGFNSYLLVVPDRRVAIVMLTNVADAHDLSAVVMRELLEELCDLRRPSWPQPDTGLPGAAEAILGSYGRYGIRVDVEREEGALRATAHVVEPLASQMSETQEPITFDLRPSTAGGSVFVARPEGGETWMPMVFFEIDGERYAHLGARAQRQLTEAVG